MTAISHHPDDATLMSYAAGSLPEPLAAVIAVHLDMCPRCRAESARLERLGGQLIEALQPVALSGPRPGLPLDSARPRPAPDVRAAPPADSRPPGLPPTLVKLAGPDLSAIEWHWLAPGVLHKRLPVSPGVTGDLRLIKVAPGMALPDHGHSGCELTLMLEGSYRDRTGLYRPGDIADLDESIEHQPVADPEVGCICLVAWETKARFKGLLARLYQPLTGM